MGELGSEGGGETRTVEQHRLTMTYSIGASVTAALLDCGAAVSLVYLVLAGGTRACCDVMRHGHRLRCGCGSGCDALLHCGCAALRCHAM